MRVFTFPMSESDDTVARRRHCILNPALEDYKHFNINAPCSIRSTMMYFEPSEIIKQVCELTKCKVPSCRASVRAALSSKNYDMLDKKGFLVHKCDIDPVDAHAWADFQDDHHLLPGIEAAQEFLDAIVQRHVPGQRRPGRKRKRLLDEEEDEEEEEDSVDLLHPSKKKKQTLKERIQALEQRVAQLEQAFVRGQNVAPIK